MSIRTGRGYIDLPPFLEAHTHLRGGERLRLLARFTARYAYAAVCMGNDPLITTPEEVVAYRDEILAITRGGEHHFEPLVGFLITEETTPEMVKANLKAGAWVAKILPWNGTTGASRGIRDIRTITPALDAVAECDGVISVHGEKAGVDRKTTNAELAFHDDMAWLANRYASTSRVVWEHITMADSVDLFLALRTFCPFLAATVGLHYLLITREHQVSNPHNECFPPAGGKSDQEALWRLLLGHDDNVMGVTDNAPHPIESKLRPDPARGIFNASVAPELWAQCFEAREALDLRLQRTTSSNAAHFYRIPVPTRYIRLVREEWTVPDYYGDDQTKVVPFMAGRRLKWRLAD